MQTQTAPAQKVRTRWKPEADRIAQLESRLAVLRARESRRFGPDDHDDLIVRAARRYRRDALNACLIPAQPTIGSTTVRLSSDKTVAVVELVNVNGVLATYEARHDKGGTIRMRPAV
jgi:hypothetical protein